MTATAPRRRPAGQNVTAHHTEWLALVDTSGPFLTLPILRDAWPAGLDAVPADLARDVARAYDEWQAEPATLHHDWVRWILTDVLELSDRVLVEGQAIPGALNHRVPEHDVTLRPDLAVLDPATRAPRLLVGVWQPGTPLDEQVDGSTWAASPRDRMAELLRAKDAHLGLVTNGEHWTLVSTTKDASTGFATWDAALWLDDRITLQSFHALLHARRFFNVPADETLAALLAKSVNAQQEVTDQLGVQVRRAVEMLVDAFSRAARETGAVSPTGTLLGAIDPRELYEAAVTVMMRLVFLLSAEERKLLLEGELYESSYAVGTLRAQLRAEADRYGEEPLEKRSAAWHRLLATFRMVHGGVQHEDLRLPAYGGSLFDPDRYPFLEGRQPGASWHDTDGGSPVRVDDRTVLHLLDALQVLQHKGRGEAQRLSYRALDVEQIGHVYEGLLDHTAVRVDEAALGLRGRKEPEVALRTLLRERDRGHEPFVTWLMTEAGLTRNQVSSALAASIDPGDWNRLLAACGGDMDLTERIAPLLGLLRTDLRGLPMVFLPGSVYVTVGLERRGSGTYYTPRSLAEEVVKHTLDPLVHNPGPAEGADQSDWKLKPAGELLRLKVCDIAMGSGAFLVAACRYLGDRVVQAWSEAEAAGEKVAVVNGNGLPSDLGDRELLARRLVADRCLYGVDKNPMAVEMAKLSMWLITLAKGRPFEFLDHALRSGDSLLGITDVDQLINFHPDPEAGRLLHRQLGKDLERGLDIDVTGAIRRAVDRAANRRRALEAFPVRDIRDAEEKQHLLLEAEVATERLLVAADALVGAALSARNGEELDDRLVEAARWVQVVLDPAAGDEDRETARSELRWVAARWLQEGKPPLQQERRCFHWPLEFPEVFTGEAGGLHAVVGNPPFQGGQKITGVLGTDYRNWLVERIANGRRGSADLVSYFFLRAGEMIREAGGFSLLATNTIAQGDTREVGLDQLIAGGWVITRAVKSRPWPGDANLEVAEVWAHHAEWSGAVVLEGEVVLGITAMLEAKGRVAGGAYRLWVNANVCYQGSIVLGTGFLLEPARAQEIIDRDPRYRDVLFPYLNGEDVNSTPGQTSSRWVINFFDWPLERAESYPECLEIVRTRVKPFRDTNKRAPRRERWWQFAERASQLYRAIDGLDQVLVLARISKTVMPTFLSTGLVFNEKTCVFSYDDYGHLGVLSSAVHYWWAVKHSSTLRADLNYAPSDCFENFPQPANPMDVAAVAQELDRHRRGLMLGRWEGLTKTYNRVHDPDEHASDIAELRMLHRELDHAVAAAYGWSDLGLDHDFYETRQGIRYTLGPAVRTKMLDRLLELNHERYADEVARGLHDKTKRKAQPKRRSAEAKQAPEQPTLGDL